MQKKRVILLLGLIEFLIFIAFASANTWLTNTSINNSLPSGSDFYLYNPAVFYKDSSWYLIRGRSDGDFFGYVLAPNGTTWLVNSTISSGLPDIGSNSAPTVFYKDSSWYLLSGEYNGAFYGYRWSGTQWVVNTTINASLPILAQYSDPEVFYKDSSWYMLSGVKEGQIKGFVWSGTQWIPNSTINASLGDTGWTPSISAFYKDSSWYLIIGDDDGTFKGYVWTGTQWQSNSTIITGLSDLGDRSLPDVFFKNENWFMISGEYSTGFYGYVWNKTYSSEPLDLTSPNITFEIPTPSNTSSTSNPVTIVANISDISSTSSWIDLDKTLVGYWSMDYYNSTGIFDNSSYGNFAVFEGGVGTSDISDGIRGNSLSFSPDENIRSYSLGANTNQTFNNSGQLTFSAWIKPSSISVFAGIMGSDTLRFHVGSDSDLVVTITNQTSIYNQIYSPEILINNQWQYVALTYNRLNGNTSVYHNGTLVASDIILNANLTKTSDYFMVGQNWWDFFSGSIDEAMVFNRTLSPSEIKALYDSKLNKFNTSSINLSSGKHNYTVYAIDENGNIANSGERNFIVGGTVSVSSCQVLDSPNIIYQLSNDVSSSGTCFNVTAQNVTIDCDDHFITYSTGGATNTYGVVTNQFNTTVRNCNILDGNWLPSAYNYTRHAIYLNSASNGTFSNNFINISTGSGIYFVSSSNYNTLNLNNIKSKEGVGISCSSSNSTFLINNILNGSRGINMVDCSKSNLTNNTVFSTTVYPAIYINNAVNNILFRNRAISVSGIGLNLNFASYNNLTQNNITILGGSQSAFQLESSSNNNILMENNVSSLSNSHGIAIYSSNFNNLTRNIGLCISGSGIYLSSSSDNILLGNNGTNLVSGGGISISNSSRINLTNNNGTSNSGYGISFYEGENNILMNNIGTSNSGYGIDLHDEFMDILINNTGTSNSGYGISLNWNGINNTLINNTAISVSSYALALGWNINITILNQIARTTGTSGTRYGVYILQSNNTLFKDCLNISGGTLDVNVSSFAGSVNNTFINCSYNTAKEAVYGAGNELIRKWYYQAKVNYSNGTAAAGANVSAYNVTNRIQFTENTNASGWIQRKEVIEYINTGGTRVFWNNYTINASKAGYITDNHIWNFTIQTNKIDDWFTLLVNTCVYTSGNWIINCSDSCTIDHNYNVGGNNVSIVGAGTIIVSGNVSNYNKLHIEGLSSSNICTVRCINGGCFKG